HSPEEHVRFPEARARLGVSPQGSNVRFCNLGGKHVPVLLGVTMVRTCRHLGVLALLILVGGCDAHQALAPDLEAQPQPCLARGTTSVLDGASDPPVLGVGLLV